MNCESCGIPEGAYRLPGYKLALQFMPHVGERWKRQQRSTVWVCGSACAVQTMAIAAMGLPSHKWPMTLKEFTSQMQAAGKLDLFAFADGRKRDKPIAELPMNSGLDESDFQNLVLGHMTGVCHARRGGRPAIENPSAATRRKRRQRAKTTH